MVFEKIFEKILNHSNSYNYYKNNYEKYKKVNEDYLNEINNLKEENKSHVKEIESLTATCSKQEEEIKYFQSLLEFEIETIEKYMYELVELNKENLKTDE